MLIHTAHPGTVTAISYKKNGCVLEVNLNEQEMNQSWLNSLRCLKGLQEYQSLDESRHADENVEGIIIMMM